jgi:hypothetical protein
MDTFRFGRRLKLRATSSIKHQLRTMMWEDEVKRAEREARAEAMHGQRDERHMAGGSRAGHPPTAAMSQAIAR